MAQRELYNSLNPGKVATVIPQNATASVESAAGIDLAGYNSALVEYCFGNSADVLSGTVYWTGTLTECATLAGTYTAVDSDDYVGTLPVVDAPAEDSVSHFVAYLGSLRYIKAGIAATGTHSSGTPLAVNVFRGHKRNLNAGN
jgi:hypothetical protein